MISKVYYEKKIWCLLVFILRFSWVESMPLSFTQLFQDGRCWQQISIQSFSHDQHVYISSGFFSNSQTFSSNLLENPEEILPRYYMHSDMFSMFISSNTYTTIYRQMVQYSSVPYIQLNVIISMYKLQHNLILMIPDVLKWEYTRPSQTGRGSFRGESIIWMAFLITTSLSV